MFSYRLLSASLLAGLVTAGASVAAAPKVIYKPTPHNSLGQEAGRSVAQAGDFSLLGSYFLGERFEDSGGAYLFENGNQAPRQVFSVNSGLTVQIQNFVQDAVGNLTPGGTYNCTLTHNMVRGAFLGERVALSNEWVALGAFHLGSGGAPPLEQANCGGIPGKVPMVFLAKALPNSATNPYSALNHKIVLPLRQEPKALAVGDDTLAVIGYRIEYGYDEQTQQGTSIEHQGLHIYDYDAGSNQWLYETSFSTAFNDPYTDTTNAGYGDNTIGREYHAALAMSGDSIIVGEPQRNTVGIYKKVNGSWTQVTNYTNYDSDRWGRSVDISGDYAVVGAEDGTYFYYVPGWSMQLNYHDPNTPANHVAIDGTRAVAVGDRPAQVYTRSGSVFQPSGTFGRFAGDSVDWRAESMDMDGDKVVIGWKGAGSPDGQHSLIGAMIYDSVDDAWGHADIIDDAEGSRLWRNDGPYDWRRHHGPTASAGTGPSAAAGGSGHYYYVETSQGTGAYTQGDEAILETPEPFSVENRVLEFDRHMFGADQGMLWFEVYYQGNWYWLNWWDGAFSSTTGWVHEVIDLDWLKAYMSEARLRFRYTAKGGYRGDIALDNISLSAY